MDKKHIYNNWLGKKRQTEVAASFSDRVMNRIYEQKPNWFDIQSIIEIISAHPIIKNGLIATGAILGFVRITYVVTMFLSKGVLNG